MTMKKPFAITLDPGSPLANKTGPWRTERPVCVDRLLPCNSRCPAGDDIQGWLSMPMAATTKRPGATGCATQPVPGHHGPPLPRLSPAADTGRHVLVVGARPSGMSAAHHLRRLGHAVTVLEAGLMAGLMAGLIARLIAGLMAGGMMRFGIPRCRLPREVLDAELRRITDMGVTLRLNSKVADIAQTMKDGGFDAAVLAAGAHIAKRSWIPAHDFELEEALQEGVMVKWLSTIKQAGEASLTIEKMALDARGFPQPTGEFETLEADSLVRALGQHVDPSLLDGVSDLQMKDGVVMVDPATMMTSHPGLFAGADMVPAERNVTVAVGHGKKAARHIDAWLRGSALDVAPQHDAATFERLNPRYGRDTPHAVRPQLDLARRTSSFDEVQGGLTEGTALCEAQRCLSCGNCFECDNCCGVCPDNTVIKLGPGKGFEFNLDFCKGCGLCAAECPSGAIDMVPEAI